MLIPLPEAEHVSGLRVEQRNVHKLRCLCVKHRASLLEAYTAADNDEPGGTAAARLPVGLWASVTTDVLKVSFGLMPLRRHLLGPSNDAATVDYAAFLHRFQLVRRPNPLPSHPHTHPSRAHPSLPPNPLANEAHSFPSAT